jgi:hypothetical protein
MKPVVLALAAALLLITGMARAQFSAVPAPAI